MTKHSNGWNFVLCFLISEGLYREIRQNVLGVSNPIQFISNKINCPEEENFTLPFKSFVNAIIIIIIIHNTFALSLKSQHSFFK